MHQPLLILAINKTLIVFLDISVPNLADMPDLTKLNGGKMPEIPAGMKLEDLKDAFYNLPPNMKERLNDMAQCKSFYIL